MRWSLGLLIPFLPILLLPAQRADSILRRTLANDLAFKAETAIAAGNRTEAFIMAEMVHRYIEAGHPGARKTLHDAFYYNDQHDRLRDSSARQSWHQGFVGHESAIIAVAFSPDGRQILTGGRDRTARLWDVNTHRELLTLYGHNASITAVAFSPDMQFALTGSEDHTAKLWNPRSGRLVRTLSAHTDKITTVDFSPDGRLVLTGSSDRTAKLWNAEDGREIRSWPGFRADVTAVAFSPDGSSLFIGSLDGTAAVYGTADGQLRYTLPGRPPFQPVLAAAFSTDGQYLILGRQHLIEAPYHTTELWHVANRRLVRTFLGHTDRITSVSLSTDNQYVLSGSKDGTIRLWQRYNGEAVRTIGGNRQPVNAATFSPDGRYFLSGDEGNLARLWPTDTRPATRTFPLQYPVLDAAATFSVDGKQLLTATAYPPLVKRWDVQSGKKVMEIDFSHAASHWEAISDIALSPDGKRVLTSSLDRTTIWWDLASGLPVLGLDHLQDHPHLAVTLSSEGRYALTGGNRSATKLWELDSGKEIQQFSTHDHIVRDVALSPDSRYALTGNSNGTARLWDVETGQLLRTLARHDARITTVAFSPDGNYLLTGSRDHTAKLWEANTGQELFSLLGHEKEIQLVSFSPDGRSAATASSDRTVKLWDLATGQATLTLSGHPTLVRLATFSPDGKLLLTGGGDPMVRLWIIATDSLLQNRYTGLAPLGDIAIATYALQQNISTHSPIWNTFLNSEDWQQQYAFGLYFARQAEGNFRPPVFHANYAKAQACLEAARRVANSVPLLRKQGHMMAKWAQKLLYTGEVEAAIRQAEAAVELYRELIRETAIYNPQIESHLVALIDQGLDSNLVANFLKELR